VFLSGEVEPCTQNLLQKRAPFYDVWFLFSKRAFAVIVTS